jgi:endonuclease/exonuclease/phosphatase family metal-dependent hydrolase
LATAAGGIAALDADVVALQEVDFLQPRSDERAQADELGRLLGWHSVFAPSLCGSPDRAWTPCSPALSVPDGPAYGIALLSRHPVLRWRRVRLPGGGAWRRRRPPSPSHPGWDHEPRVLLQAQIDVGGTVVHVATTHLSYLPWRGARQLRSAVAALGDARPAVLLGDFNLPPGAVDAVTPSWRSAGGEPTYPAPDPRIQLDQILVRGLGVDAVRVAPATSSDHRALVAELSLP